MDDKDHEAYGAMIHRGKVEQATNTRNYHREQKEALDLAVEALREISTCFPEVANEIADKALEQIEEKLG